MDMRRGQPLHDLSGEWSLVYTLDPEATVEPTADALGASGLPLIPARVPGNFELDLVANGIEPEPFVGMSITRFFRYENARLWYFRRFEAEDRPERDSLLTFEGLDCFADVYLNGCLLGSTANMLVEHTFCVNGLLRGDNELVVAIRPAVPEAGAYPHAPGLAAQPTGFEGLWVRKAPHTYGWDIMPRAVSAGIWRPVSLRCLPRARLEWAYLDTLSIGPDGSYADMALSYQGRIPNEPGWQMAAEGACDGSRFETRAPALSCAGVLRFRIEKPKLWWPRGRGEPALYEVRVRLSRDGEEVDALSLSAGIRTVGLDRTSTTDSQGRGEFCFRVNGERFFALGTNWVPLDAYHSRDIERVDRAVGLLDEAGCNMVRCWGGNVYESDRFYDLLDRRGVLVWQDFAMACAVYPQAPSFQAALGEEARKVVRRLRQHACIALWAGDNECDMAYGWSGRARDPNENALTRCVLPQVLRDEDPSRPYLPSSPYIDREAFVAGERWLPENHLWGPRDYFRSAYYAESLCHFASEVGYHGCPSPESLRQFLSPDRLWPYTDNPEWLLHATSPVPGVNAYDYRVALMANQVREMFGETPDNLEAFSWASQACQAEAKKHFVELFRGAKWRRTGILWWNLIDGWPQFSDAVVDYYGRRKLAFHFLRTAQQPLLLMLREPAAWGQDLVACNDTREDLPVAYSVRDVDTGEAMAGGEALARADSATTIARVAHLASWRRMYAIAWTSPLGQGRSHYLCGHPPFDVSEYRRWIEAAGMLPQPVD
ncbi:MAG TPA: hypothetical protein VLH79_12020 [Chthonomonadales bacterium]|nr:hypothetical protein [Chthonomonadales bacterium]